MENQQMPTNKIALNYGLILGFASILISVIVYALGMHYEQDWKVGVLSFIVMAVIIFMGIKEYRKSNGGLLSLGQGLKTGVGIALIGGVISVIYSMIFMNFIEPDYMENMLEVAQQKLLDNPRFTEEMVENQMEMSRKFATPAISAAFALVGSLFFGFIISLIASLVMKKTDEEVTSI